MSGLQIIDVTLPALVRGRDLPDEALGTVAGWLDNAGFQMVEVADGHSFFSTFHRHGKDPWERIRVMTDQVKKTPSSMLVRGRFLLGEKPQPDRVIGAFADQCVQCGVKMLRVYDPLGDIKGMKTVIGEIRKVKGLEFQGCIPVTGGQLDGVESIAGQLEEMGAGSICLWNSSESIRPDKLASAVSRIKETIAIPVYVQFGGSDMLWAYSGLFDDDPAPDGLVTGLGATARFLDVPLAETALFALKSISVPFPVAPESLARLNEDLESLVSEIPENKTGYDAGLRMRAAVHGVPPGLAARAAGLLEEAGALGVRDRAFAEALKIRADIGQIPLVPPLNRIIATQAVNNVMFDAPGKRYTVVSDGFRDICSGSFGQLPETIDASLCRHVRQGVVAVSTEEIPESPLIDSGTRGDALIRCMFPEAGSGFLFRQDFGWDPMETGLAETSSIHSVPEPADSLLDSGPIRRFRVEVEGTLFDVGVSEINGKPEILGVSQLKSPTRAVPDTARVRPPEVPVVSPKPEPRPEKIPAEENSASEAATAGDILQMKAPMPGTVIRVAVSPGQRVTKGDPVMILEAMKMENTLPAPESGEIYRIPVVEGGSVAKGELLCEFRRTA